MSDKLSAFVGAEERIGELELKIAIYYNALSLIDGYGGRIYGDPSLFKEVEDIARKALYVRTDQD